MTDVAELLLLQDTDVALDRALSRLIEIEAALGEPEELVAARETAAEKAAAAHDAHSQQKDLELAADTIRGKAADIEKKWLLIDASGLVVGRLATIVAMRLRGKHKATYTPHVDDGDNVIIVNAAKAVLTGRKSQKKVYYKHTGYIGGIKEVSAKSIMAGKFPERIVEKAIERMLPRGPLGRVQLGNLRVYPGPEHPHEAQKPEKLDVAAMNRKNVRSA
jgi:large subunit ribosomal protein L13